VTEIATQIRSSLSLQTILDTTVAQVRQLLDCDRVNIWQVEADWQTIVVAESIDLSIDLQSIDSPRSLIGTRIDDTCFKQDQAEVYRQGKIRVVSDIYTTPMSDCHRDMLIRFQIRAKILVPLLCGNELWGFLNVTESQKPREWQSEEVELLDALSVQLAIALQQATTYQKLQEQLIERQQAEARLRESEQRYVTLTAAAPVGIFRTDALGNCVYVNDRWCQIAGLSPEEAAGLGWINGIYPDERELVSTAWYAAAQENRSFTLEYRFQRPDGAVTWVYGQSVAEQDANGTIIGYVGTITDISDRKQAEAALIQSEAQSRAILAAIPDFMFRISADGIYREFVAANGEIDLLPENLNPAGLAMADVLPPEIAARQKHYIEQALSTGELQIYEQQVQIGDRLQDEEVRVVKNGEDEVLFMIRDISIRKRSQEALQRSEAHQRALIRAIPDLIMRIDRAGIYLEFVATPNFFIVGNLAEIVGTHLSSSLPPDAAQKRMEYIELALQTNSIQIYEQDLSIDGRTQIEEVRIVPYSENEVLALVRDISDRKQAEQQLYQLNQDLEIKVGERTAELREREKFLQTVLDTFPLSVFWKDRDSVYLGCNHYFLQDSGLTSDMEIIGKTDYELPWSTTEAEVYQADDRQVMDSGIARLGIVEQTQSQADGRQVWLETNKIPLHNLGGEIVGILGTYQDISDRKQAEQTIRQQAEQERLLREITQRIRQSLDLQTIFDTACQEIRQVIQADRVGIFKFHAESNFDNGEFVAESVVEGFPSVVAIPIQDHCFGKNYSSLYAKGRSYVVDDIYYAGMSACHTHILAQFQVRANLVVPLLCGDGLWGLLCIHQCATTRRWQQFEVDFNKQLANQLAIAIQQSNLVEQLQTELAERHRAEARLTETNAQLAISNEELARATRLKDEFLANMSHELRTPLNAILGMTEGLQEAVFGAINDRQRRALQTIEHSGAHLLELINDILDVAKIEAGQIELECSSVSVAHLCQSSLAFVKQRMFQKRIRLEVKLPDHLPHLLVDERRIRQVLINLLNNAVKFTPEAGQISLEVSQLAPDCLQIAVRDTGIGIAPEHIGKLFQPFIQIDSALNRQYEGTGLGLALVKRLVELHGGRVTLDSELGVGSCFAINLPCDPNLILFATRQPEPSTAAPDLVSPAEPTTRSPLILLAEDNEANINTVSSYLRAKGYRILLAKTGQEAIDLAQLHRPDLILMDVQMPGMDGLEAIRQLKANSELNSILIIALTALAMPDDRQRCLDAGAKEYLAKPVRLKELFQLIQALLVP
jgi:PAS domain S-box-containing protein